MLLLQKNIKPHSADNLPYEKVGKNGPVCIADEVPFEIPESWEWVRLKNLVKKEIKRGKSPKYAVSSNIQVFAQKCNVKAGGIDMTLAKYLDDTVFPKYPEEECMRDSDIVINSTGNGTLGRIGMFHDSDRINENIIVPDSHVTVIRASEFLSADYIFYVLNYYQPYLEKSCSGSTNQTELKPAVISELFIPVPPVNEQTRIITKLIEALNLSKLYGEKEILLQKYNQDFPEQLKKSILQYAIQGKLVPQNPSGEPAAVLLERIRAEKQKLIAEGKIKKDKNESVIFRRDNSHYEKRGSKEACIDEKLPFDIPSNWTWCRLRSLLIQASTGPFGSMLHKEDYTLSGVPLVNPANITDGRIISTKLKYVSPTTGQRLKSYSLHPGDVIIGRRGEMGRSAVVLSNQSEWLCGTGCFFVTPCSILNPEYLVFLLGSPYVRSVLIAESVGTTMNNLNHNILGDILIPLPPFNEQTQIMRKYAEVIAPLGV